MMGVEEARCYHVKDGRLKIVPTSRILCPKNLFILRFALCLWVFLVRKHFGLGLKKWF